MKMIAAYLRPYLIILLGDFNEKVRRRDKLNPTVGNVSLPHSGIRVVNFVTSENLIIKRTLFPHRNVNLMETHTYLRK
jgi:hypothetical protein